MRKEWLHQVPFGVPRFAPAPTRSDETGLIRSLIPIHRVVSEIGSYRRPPTCYAWPDRCPEQRRVGPVWACWRQRRAADRAVGGGGADAQEIAPPRELGGKRGRGPTPCAGRTTCRSGSS